MARTLTVTALALLQRVLEAVTLAGLGVALWLLVVLVVHPRLTGGRR